MISGKSNEGATFTDYVPVNYAPELEKELIKAVIVSIVAGILFLFTFIVNLLLVILMRKLSKLKESRQPLYGVK